MLDEPTYPQFGAVYPGDDDPAIPWDDMPSGWAACLPVSGGNFPLLPQTYSDINRRMANDNLAIDIAKEASLPILPVQEK